MAASAGRFKATANTLQSKATMGQGYDVMSAYKGGLVPKEYLGLGYASGGNSVFSNVAHNVEQARRLENIQKNSISDEVSLAIKLKGKGVNQPFEMNGKIYRPDKDGNVRITDKGKIDTVMEIKRYQRKVVDDLMDYAMLGDDVCQYIFGLTETQWDNLTKKNTAANAEYGLSAELNNLDCSIQHIESLPPSLTQTQAIAKLRKIVEYHASSVNIEGITTHSDAKKNISDGHNNPSDVKKDTELTKDI